MQALQKISIFKGLELEHIQRLLRVGTSRKYELGERVCTIGEDSNEMLVLLQGLLAVTSSAGDVLGGPQEKWACLPISRVRQIYRRPNVR